MTHRYLVVALATLGFVTPSGAAQNRARVRKLVKQNRSSLPTQKRLTSASTSKQGNVVSQQNRSAPAKKQPVQENQRRRSPSPSSMQKSPAQGTQRRNLSAVKQQRTAAQQSAQITTLARQKEARFQIQAPGIAEQIDQLNPQDRDFLIKNLNKVTTQKMAENMVKWVAQKAAQPKAQNQTQPNVTPKNQAQQIKIKEMQDKIDQLTKEKDAAMEKATKEKADLEKKVEEARSSASGDSNRISNLQREISQKD